MKSKPFGVPESIVDRIRREEFLRIEEAERMIGATSLNQALVEAQRDRDLLAAVEQYHAVDTAQRATRLAGPGERLGGRATFHWALSLLETERELARLQPGLLEQQHQFGSVIADTMNAFQAQLPAIEAALAAEPFEAYRRELVNRVLPGMQLYGAIAEQMRLIDAMTLRASADPPPSAMALLAEEVIEAQQIAEAIADAEDAEAGVQLLGRLVHKLVEFFDRFGDNTVREFQQMGLVGLVGVMSAILGFATLLPHQAQKRSEDHAGFETLNRKLDRMQDEARRYGEASAEREKALLAGLPRAQLSRAATLRRSPMRSGAVVLEAQAGMELAIARREGKWRLALFRDPLSNQLLRAWVYETAVTPLSEPVR
jgi:hypothetical protein